MKKLMPEAMSEEKKLEVLNKMVRILGNQIATRDKKLTFNQEVAQAVKHI